MSGELMRSIRELTLLCGCAGDEGNVREYILSKISPFVQKTEIDPLGNLIAFKKGKRRPQSTLMVAAHMDEVALIVTGITDEGYLKFSTVGGINERVLCAKRVLVGQEKLSGVIGVKPVHLLKGEEKDKTIPVDSLLIDIGAKNRAEAEKWVELGDRAYFDSGYMEFGDGFIKAKALDDRAGCAMMLELIQSEIEYDTFFVFTVGEEIGLVGAATASFSVDPDVALVLEATTCSDIHGVDPLNYICEAGKGPVLSFMDGATAYCMGLYRFASQVADKNQIPWQPKAGAVGGNDAGAIHKSRGGSKPIAVSLPCRYIHSASCVLKKEDIQQTYRLVQALCAVLPERKW